MGPGRKPIDSSNMGPHGDENRGLGALLRIALREVDDIFHESLEQTPLRGSSCGLIRNAHIECGTLCLQELFDAPADEHRHICFYFRSLIEFGALHFVYLVHRFDGHVCFACQTFDIRFPVCKIL